jgi:cation transport ATPase
MHDVNRDSLITDAQKRQVKKSGADHAHEEHDHEYDHGHDHGAPHGHNHDHAEDAYEEHDRDLHAHGHEHGGAEDRAFAHLHDHGHDFFHAHHHTHHPEHAGVVHKIFGDPLRDWFGAFLMVLLIGAGYFKWLPGYLSDGMLVCAAVIGIFPLLKNALFDVLYKRRFCFELVVGLVLLAGLFTGRLLEVALLALLLLVGSFMRLNFSWKD